MNKILTGLAIAGLIMAILVMTIGALITTSTDYIEFCGKNNSNSCDAVVAISGGNTSERTLEAVKIYQQGYAKKLIFSGANSDPKVMSDAKQMVKIAEKHGVKSSEILAEETARNTQENAEQVAKIVKKYGFKRVILTTSPYHQRRAYLEFQRAMADQSVKIYNAPASGDTEFSSHWWLNVRGWYLASSEVFGILRFYLR